MIKKELKESLNALGRLWLTEINAAKLEKRQTDQLQVFQKFLASYSLQYQYTCLLIQSMISTATNTSPVERGYTILQIIASKRRNRISPENLELLFLLGTLKIPVKSAEDYKQERKRLEKK